MGGVVALPQGFSQHVDHVSSELKQPGMYGSMAVPVHSGKLRAGTECSEAATCGAQGTGDEGAATEA